MERMHKSLEQSQRSDNEEEEEEEEEEDLKQTIYEGEGLQKSLSAAIKHDSSILSEAT